MHAVFLNNKNSRFAGKLEIHPELRGIETIPEVIIFEGQAFTFKETINDYHYYEAKLTYTIVEYVSGKDPANV